MDGIDATDRQLSTSDAPPPASLITIILDTNPVAWDALSTTLSLSKAISNLLVFINAHLAINHANRIAVIASHTDRASWLYPTPNPPTTSQDRENGESGRNGIQSQPQNEDANKYRPFLAVEQQVLSNLRKLMEGTNPEVLANGDSTQIAGALTMSLTYINKQNLLSSPSGTDMNYNSTSEVPVQNSNPADNSANPTAQTLVSRILVLSVSSDLSDQYISVMNAIFASQRQQIPIDVLKLAGSTVFLQQASDATGGIYLAPETRGLKGGAGLLQYLMMGYLPDVTARHSLVMPGKGEVDFRAACFCHRKVVSLGYVCSVCLSIFCDPAVLPNNCCLTCGTPLTLPTSYNVKPALIQTRRAPKKVKKKRPGDPSASGTGTPVPGMETSGSGTPAR